MDKITINTYGDNVIVLEPNSGMELDNACLTNSFLESVPPLIERDYRIQFLSFFMKQSYSTMLDISCGKYAKILKWARWMGFDVVGTNIDEEAIKQNERDGIKCVRVDLNDENLQLPFKDDSFDVVVCTEVIEHIKYPKKVIDEMYRVSKYVCLITTPLGDSYNTPDHINFWYIDDFVRELLNGYDNYTLRTIVTKPMDLLLNWRVFIVSIHKR